MSPGSLVPRPNSTLFASQVKVESSVAEEVFDPSRGRQCVADDQPG
jgi:hypothetical protein